MMCVYVHTCTLWMTSDCSCCEVFLAGELVLNTVDFILHCTVYRNSYNVTHIAMHSNEIVNDI